MKRRDEEKVSTYESVAFGFSGVLVSDYDSFKNVAELLEIFAHFFGGSLPGQSSHEQFGEGCVSEG